MTYLYNLLDEHPERKAELDTMFQVEQVYNLKEGTHKKVLSFCLFWKSAYLCDPQQVVNEKTIFEKNKFIKQNKSFYETYVQPLLEQLKVYKTETYPEGWVARVYLAHDLAFLSLNF